MNISFLPWSLALVFTIIAHVYLLGSLYTGQEILIEQSAGPVVELIGGNVLAEIEDKVENAIESQASQEVKTLEEPAKQEEKKPEEIKEVEVPKEEARENSIEEQKSEKPRPAEKKEEPKKTTESKPDEPVVKMPEPEKPKPVEKKKEKPSPKSVAQRKTGGKTVASKQGGGSRGRQTSVAGNADLTNYKGKISSWLSRFKNYPEDARRNRIQGTAVVTFAISSSGRLISVRLVRSSGSSVLDNAAVNTVRSASPFPAIPASSGKQQLTFTSPIGFNIR